MRNKTRYVYLVLCNKTPIVYGVHSTKKKALEYCYSLIAWRFDHAKQRDLEHGYYHREDFLGSPPRKEFDRREKYMFSACLKIKDGLETSITDDGCYVQCIRRELLP